MTKFHDTLKKLHERATPGPWKLEPREDDGANDEWILWYPKDSGDSTLLNEHNASLLGFLRNSVPKLLRLLEAASKVHLSADSDGCAMPPRQEAVQGLEDALEALDVEARVALSAAIAAAKEEL